MASISRHRWNKMHQAITVTLAIIVVAIIILLVISFKNVSEHNELLKELIVGLWVCDPAFCAKSDIDGMMIYIGPDIGSSEHKAYLIMYANDIMILQKTLTLRIDGDSLSPYSKRKFVRGLHLSEDDSQDTSLSGVMPFDQTLSYDLATGKMTWTGIDDGGLEKVFAEFYKDSISSNSI